MAEDGALPNIGAPSYEQIKQAHLDKRSGAGATPLHKAAADQAAGQGIASAHVASAPMAVGAKMSAAVATADATTGGISSTPVSRRFATPIK